VTTGAESVFLDTNVLVGASVVAHPSNAVATGLVARLADHGVDLFISPQVCREFLAVLTRGPVEGRNFSSSEAVDALDRWMSGCFLLDDSDEVLAELVMLVARRSVRGRQVHDANVVATMIANRITRLATLDLADFRRYEDLVSLEPVTS
jgi:predicted nucleic acid-binding protein